MSLRRLLCFVPFAAESGSGGKFRVRWGKVCLGTLATQTPLIAWGASDCATIYYTMIGCYF